MTDYLASLRIFPVLVMCFALATIVLVGAFDAPAELMEISR